MNEKERKAKNAADPFNINFMTPEQRADRLEALKLKLDARTRRDGSANPGFALNVQMILDEIDELESRK